MEEILAIQLTSKPFVFDEFSDLGTKNRKTTEHWLTESTEVGDLGRAMLYKRRTVEDGLPIEWFFAVDPNGITHYVVKVADIKASPLRAGCQVGVWSDPGFATTVRFAPRVFWEVLFDQHDIISDTIQTEFGRRFWINRVGEAYGKDLCVYWLDLKGQKIRNMRRIKTIDDFNDMSPKIWGSAVAMRSVRLAITKNPLKFS